MWARVLESYVHIHMLSCTTVVEVVGASLAAHVDSKPQLMRAICKRLLSPDMANVFSPQEISTEHFVLMHLRAIDLHLHGTLSMKHQTARCSPTCRPLDSQKPIPNDETPCHRRLAM